jgi:hypothetical protein
VAQQVYALKHDVPETPNFTLRTGLVHTGPGFAVRDPLFKVVAGIVFIRGRRKPMLREYSDISLMTLYISAVTWLHPAIVVVRDIKEHLMVIGHP